MPSFAELHQVSPSPCLPFNSFQLHSTHILLLHKVWTSLFPPGPAFQREDHRSQDSIRRKFERTILEPVFPTDRLSKTGHPHKLHQTCSKADHWITQQIHRDPCLYDRVKHVITVKDSEWSRELSRGTVGYYYLNSKKKRIRAISTSIATRKFTLQAEGSYFLSNPGGIQCFGSGCRICNFEGTAWTGLTKIFGRDKKITYWWHRGHFWHSRFIKRSVTVLHSVRA
jgi:hypothetical protein